MGIAQVHLADREDIGLDPVLGSIRLLEMTIPLFCKALAQLWLNGHALFGTGIAQLQIDGALNSGFKEDGLGHLGLDIEVTFGDSSMHGGASSQAEHSDSNHCQNCFFIIVTLFFFW